MSAPLDCPPSTDQCNQIFIKACEDQQNGLLASAKTGYLQLLDYFSGAPLLHYNLGLVYYEEEEYEKSRDSFAKAAKLSPLDMDVLFNLGLSQKKCGDMQGAIASYLTIIAKEPEDVDSLYNLAGCYKDSRQYTEAIETYVKVLQFSPSHLSATSNLAYVYHLAGESERAIHYYKKVLECNPEHQSAKHMLGALTSNGATGSSESYVREVFDDYSDHYEHSLVDQLEYCVPSTIRGLFDQGGLLNEKLWKNSFDHGLDLGCGTGLGGQSFADLVTILDGVDLSADMLSIAKSKNIYRSLHSEEIVHFLQASKESYDFFLAADVFAYLGGLEETFCLLKKRARPDVLFCFSSETAAPVAANIPQGRGYGMQLTGRFAHEPDYISRVAEATGWEILARHDSSLRKEKGVWVQGDLWFLGLADS